MSDYANTVKDVSRAVAYLDEHANGHPEVSLGVSIADMRARVASNLSYQFARHNGWGGRKNVTTRDVRAALISHGASAFTVERHARAIASIIRADFSDGWNYHKGES